jgi:transglutaminase-like putative cysteine protease
LSSKKNISQKRLRFLDIGSALMWAVAWLVMAYTMATPSATAASSLGAFVAFFLGRRMATSNLRTATVTAAIILLGPIILSVADFPNRSPFVAGFFPSAQTLVFITDFVWWGILSVLVVGLLQFLSNRYQGFISLEVLTVALFLASPFAAHRDGFINRPYFLIDPLWSRGYDPVPIFQWIGVIVAVCLILLTVGRATQRSSMFDVILLIILAIVLYAKLPEEKVREYMADPPSASGLTGEPEEQLESEAQGGQGQPPDDPFPFESDSDPDDPKPVAVIIFRDDYEPPDGYYYFRQTAFSQFNGFRLVKDTTGEADKDLFRRFATSSTNKDVPDPPSYLSTEKLDTRVALISSHTEPFGLVKPLQMAPVSNPNPDKFERAYEVVSHVFTGDYKAILESQLVDPSWSKGTVEHYLHHPDDPRYKELADQIIAGIPEQYRHMPVAKVLAINLYLGEKGKYTTRKRPVSGSEDPTADFLFGDMTGYCVHFSHSSVYLLRAAGVPARVGAGYAVESRDRRGSALLILSSRAHAWPEVWIDGLGWYPMDVAPQTYLDPPVPPPDYDLQSMLAEMAREEGEEYEQIRQIDFRQMLNALLAAIWAFMPWLFSGLALLCYGLKAERRWGYVFENGEKKVHAYYKSALDKAYDGGFIRLRGQGRLSFAEQNVKELPSLTPLTSAHLEHTFGKEGRAQTDMTQLTQNYKKFHRELTEAVPLWRRLLGSLNPISWIFTR